MSNPWDPNSGQPPAGPPPGTPPPPPAAPGVPPAPQQPAPQYPDPQQPAQQYPPSQYPGQPTPPGAVPPGQYPPAPPAADGGGSGGKGGKIAVGVAGLLLLGGAGAFALTSMGGDGGPSSAEDAVEDVLEAVADEDLLGLLGAIDPGERDALRDNVDDLLGHLQRMEVLDDSFEADGVDGIDIEIDFDTVEYEVEEIRDGLSRVYITEGEIEYSFDPADVPLGDLVTDFAGDIDFEDGHGSVDFADATDPFFLVARDTGDDGWRVSVGYTVAEILRFEAGDPDLEAGIDAIGEDSPEAAVEGFLRVFEGESIDMEEFVARLSPSELGALQEYLPTFVGDLAEIEYPDFEFSLDDIELSSETSGNTALVTIDSMTATISEPSGRESVEISFDDGCLAIDTSESPSFERELAGTPFEDEVCGDDPIGIIEDLGSSVADAPDVDLQFGTFGVQTAQVDGEWYIAPVNTALSNLNTVLEPIDRDTIEELLEFGGTLAGSVFTGGFDDIIDIPDPLDPPASLPTTSTTTTTEPDGPDEPESPDYDAVTPDPSLGFSESDLAEIEGIAEYVSTDPVEALCAYELIVTGAVPADELLRSWREDSSPSDEAAAHLANIESVCT